MLRSAKFLEAYSDIEKHMRLVTESDRYVSFYQLIAAAAKRSPPVHRYKDDLKEYADLRNAIVHERSGGEVIAEPNERVVDSIERLAELITSPPRVLPLFQRMVQTIESDAPISQVLSFFFPRNLSQLPVMSRGKIIGLLTTNTVSRWLADQAKHELVDVTEHSVGDALKYAEFKGDWCLVSKSTLLAEVIDSFDSAEAGGMRLEAVLVTHSGKSNEALLGIVTVHDIPKALRKLDPRPSSRAA